MIYTKCPNCGVNLEIDENDSIPGCRESEEVYCPKCNAEVTKVFTSGFPVANIIEKKASK